jgi:hypothetical protein
MVVLQSVIFQGAPLHSGFSGRQVQNSTGPDARPGDATSGQLAGLNRKKARRAAARGGLYRGAAN